MVMGCGEGRKQVSSTNGASFTFALAARPAPELPPPQELFDWLDADLGLDHVLEVYHQCRADGCPAVPTMKSRAKPASRSRKIASIGP